jgi:hypothetical protein
MVSTAAEKPMLYLEDNVLAAGNYNVSMSSSDISLIVRIEAGEEVVVDEGMALGYTVPQKGIDGWTEVDFDDSGWKGGKSGIGYSDNDDNTNIRGAAGAILLPLAEALQQEILPPGTPPRQALRRIIVLLKWRLVSLTRHGGTREVSREPQSSFVMQEAHRLE